LIAGFEFCQDYAEAGSSKRCIFNEGSPFHIVKIEVWKVTFLVNQIEVYQISHSHEIFLPGLPAIAMLLLLYHNQYGKN
jgi:hypothetical protein